METVRISLFPLCRHSFASTGPRELEAWKGQGGGRCVMPCYQAGEVPIAEVRKRRREGGNCGLCWLTETVGGLEKSQAAFTFLPRCLVPEHCLLLCEHIGRIGGRMARLGTDTDGWLS